MLRFFEWFHPGRALYCIMKIGDKQQHRRLGSVCLATPLLRSTSPNPMQLLSQWHQDLLLFGTVPWASQVVQKSFIQPYGPRSTRLRQDAMRGRICNLWNFECRLRSVFSFLASKLRRCLLWWFGGCQILGKWSLIARFLFVESGLVAAAAVAAAVTAAMAVAPGLDTRPWAGAALASCGNTVPAGAVLCWQSAQETCYLLLEKKIGIPETVGLHNRRSDIHSKLKARPYIGSTLRLGLVTW